MVRPWKAPSAATIPLRPVRRLSLMAASIASAPELAKKTAEPSGRPGERHQPLGQLDLALGGEQVGDVDGLAGLLADGADQGRVTVAEGVHGDATDQVEVAVAVDVPDVAPTPVGQHQWREPEDPHDRALVALEQLVVARAHQDSSSATIMVPIPSEVKTSRSSECGWRPSMTWACGTPPSHGADARLELGDHAGVDPRQQLLRARRPSATTAASRGRASRRRRPRRRSASTSLCALSATASAAAAVSALMLSTWPSTSRSGATVETTGMRPASRMSCTAAGVDRLDVTDESEVDLLAVDVGAATARAEERGVLPRQPDRHRTVLVEQADELAADLAGEHHPHHVHDLGGGDPQATPELALQAEPVEHRGDLRTTAVHDDGTQPGIPQEGDVLGEGGLEVVVDHGVAAVLHDDERAPELLEPGQRLDEGLGLALGDAQGGRADVAADGVGGARWRECS